MSKTEREHMEVLRGSIIQNTLRVAFKLQTLCYRYGEHGVFAISENEVTPNITRTIEQLGYELLIVPKKK